MEKNTKSGKINYFYAFLAGFVMYLIGMIPILVSSGGVNMYMGDYNLQIIPFWKHMCSNYQNGIPYFDWDTGLGVNYIASYSFYGLTSPFTLILSLFPMKIIPYALNFVNAAKFGLASMGACLYCRRYVQKDSSALICGILYSFSGVQIYSMFTQFNDSIALFPFLIFAIDELIYKKRCGIFAFFTAICAFTNYFYFWSEFVFILIYFIVKVITGEYKIKVKIFIKLVIESIVGTLMSFVILLPTMLLLTNNSRASNLIFDTNLLSYEESGTLWRVFCSAFFLPDLCTEGFLFSNTQLDVSGVSLYIPLFLFVGVIYIIKKNRKKWYSILIGVCGIFAFFPILNSAFSMFNSNYYARWFFMPILIMVMITGKFLDEFETADIKRELTFTSIVTGAFILYGIYTIISQKNSGNYNSYYMSALGLSAVSLAVIYACRYSKGKEKINPNRLTWLTMCFGCVGILICSIYTANIEAASYCQFYVKREYNEGSPVEIDDSEFFRVSTQDNDDYNTSINWGYPSINVFHSLIPGNETNFYSLVGLYRESNDMSDQRDYALNSFLSVKYDLYYNRLLVGNIEVEPEDVRFYKPGFEQKDIQNRYIIYENKSYIPMGFTYDYYLNENEFTPLLAEQEEGDKVIFGKSPVKQDKEIDAYKNQKLLLKAIWLNDEQIEKYADILQPLPDDLKEDTSDETYFKDCENRKETACYSFETNDKGFVSKINMDRDNLVFYSVDYDEGFTAYVDGEEVEIEKVFGGLSAVYVPKGDHVVEFVYTVSGLKKGAVISLLSLAVYVVYIIVNLAVKFRKKEL